MGDPLSEQNSAIQALAEVYHTAGTYLAELPERPVREPRDPASLAELDGDLPQTGDGSRAVIARLLRASTSMATHSSGPRFYDFVTGGATPAAMAADWLVSLLDQNAAGRGSSNLATDVETIALRWLQELFGLPAAWGGALVASATFANLTGLACATHWWGEQQGVDTAEKGLFGLPRMPVLSGGYVHPTTRKALQLLGHGKDTVQVLARDEVGRVDLEAVERRLAAAGGPAVIVANAGEVNAGDFDPIDALADLAEQHGAWLHVDGAFGLYAALSPHTAHLVRGVDRAHSIGSDAHKWLNVPHESGFALLRDPARLGRAFGLPGAPYLPDATGPLGGFAALGPETSRRARALPIWATLAAYGREGYSAMIERHVALARHLGRRVDEADDLELLAEVQLCIVCFRYRPPELPEENLAEVNRRLSDALAADGRFAVGKTTYAGQIALRACFTNWRIRADDIDLLVDVVQEVGASVVAGRDQRPEEGAGGGPAID